MEEITKRSKAELQEDPKKSPAKPQEKEQKASKAGTVFGVILCIILIPILIVNVTMIIKGKTNPDKVPNFLGYSPMIVLTGSMEPTIKENDLIVIKTVDPAELKEQDIITFFDPASKNNSVVTHRIVRINRAEDGSLTFTTKGDFNDAEDIDAVPADNLIGTYKFRLPGLGWVAMQMSTPLGLVVCVAVPLILLVAYALIRRRKYERSKDQDTKALLAELEELRKRQAESESKGSSAESAEEKPAE